ncbi:hypothetical protein P22_1022 [Propionispora sp. 2/2-37]|uniref:zinc-dependent dehydrogenase n=1 Tax=Propionispora sp. 2/2-37 TaxID=1677858 RepID=UPI0006BB9188|nr:zinc-dependent dehydrogenase [Propionispora sp. 2/2-37]CUH94953.1 hypothetical protein P22_1022 [Propionispora sp. 2/2-37]
MKAAVYYGPKDIRIEEREIPQIGAGDVLVRVQYCAICGTDVRIYNYGQANVVPPRITGHELTGIIEKVGSQVKNYQTGDKIVLVPIMPCGTCEFCLKGKSNLCDHVSTFGYTLDGGFAEYIKIPENAVKRGNVIKLTDDADLLGTSITEPLSCVINGQEYLDIGLGDTVLVIGAGTIGAMHVSLAKARGAAKVILADIEQARLELSGKCGADYLVNSKTSDLIAEVMRITEGKGVDIAITACSVPVAQEQALQLVRKAGKVSFFAGLPKGNSVNALDMNIVHYKEISVFGAYGSTIAQNMKAYQLLSNKIIDAGKIITHVLPLEQLTDGFEMVKKGQGLKIAIKL